MAENLPESPFSEITIISSPSPSCNTCSSPMVTQQNPHQDLDAASPRELVLLLQDADLREEVIDKLIKKQATCEDLATLLWNTFNAVWILLQEILAVYLKLSPSKLSMRESAQACNALALFQVMANNPETRKKLIQAQIPYYFYPFLKHVGDDRPLNYLRHTSLAVLGSLTEFDDAYGPEILHFFMESKVVPLCLECMDLGDELSRKMATLILMKILTQEAGLIYCCASAERFFSIVQVLKRVVEKLAIRPCWLHLKYVIQCYLCLSEILRFVWPLDAFRNQVPLQLFDSTFNDILRDDPETSWILQLLHANIFGFRQFPKNQDMNNNIASPDTTTQKAKGKVKGKGKGKK